MDAKQSAFTECLGGRSNEPPSSLHAAKQRRCSSLVQYIDGILSGDRTILAQAITLVESSRAADRDLAEQIVERCLPFSGNSLRIGITGVPGAGKSSLIEALGSFLIDKQAQKVAVLAVDPTSQLSGGSVLGDKVRMASLAASDMAFIRGSPSRGAFGGVAQRTRESMLLCEAAGYRNILIETVGVGQCEAAVYDMVDFFILVAITGAGDEVQGLKRGLMELADVVLINKADGENLRAAEQTVAETTRAQHLLRRAPSEYAPRAIACSAHTGRGIAELWNCVLEHAALTKANGWFDANRCDQRRRWMHEAVQDGLRQFFNSHPLIRIRMGAFEREVLAGRTTPFRAARMLLDMYSNLASGGNARAAGKEDGSEGSGAAIRPPEG